MPVSTYIDRARTRVQAEQDAATRKQRAFEAFADRVREVPAESPPSSAAGATAGTTLTVDAPSEDRCRAVRTAAAETIHPAFADDGSASPLVTVREELSEPVAAALSPTTDASFTPEVKRTVLAAAAERRAETTALERALSKEASRLADAGEVVDEVLDWIATADETPLTDLGFDDLRERHEVLAGHRERVGETGRRRQAFLDGTTNEGAQAGVRHRAVVGYLYEDFPVEHPVLATVAGLDEACAACQRAVRRHLVRRA